MAQSYVGKHAISKGIGRAIRKFVAFAFSAHVLGHRRRACAVPDIQSEHRTSCAARCEAFFRQQTRSAGKPSLGKFKSSASWFSAATEKSDGSRRLGGRGRGCATPSAMAACDTAPGRSAAGLPYARLDRADRRYK